MPATAAKNSKLILAAMIFAVSMTFIDQTIVAIALPEIQDHVGLSTTGSQWIINGYLLALSALFAFGGRLADIAGHRKMVVLGTIVFATASALCGATPTGSAAETWLIVFRIIQGAGAAIMFPAALAIVLEAFPVAERGRAMAIFFGIAGGLTSIGPIAGGYLTQWTWRSIFWINVPVAIIALILVWLAKPDDTKHPAGLDYRGTVLVTGAMGLVVLGLQQSAVWGWGSVATWACIVVGLLLGVAFLSWERRCPQPLLNLKIFRDPGFSAETAVLGLMSITFVPFFFFASIYAQVSLGKSASEAGLYILYFFIGFVVASQIGGRILDQQGARLAVVLGGAIGAVGFFLLAGKVTDLNINSQWYYIALAGAGPGLILATASTDAVNRAPSSGYSEVTGITQTARNFGGSFGLAVMGAILVSLDKTNVTNALTKAGVPTSTAHHVAASFGQGAAGSASGHSGALVHSVQLAFADSIQTIFYIMAGVMAVTL